MFAVDDRIRRGALLGKMHNRFGFEILYYVGKKIVLRYIADKELNDISGEFLPNSKAICQWTDGRKGLHAKFMVPLAGAKIIENRHRMPLVRQIQSGCPTTVPIASQHRNSHLTPLPF